MSGKVGEGIKRSQRVDAVDEEEEEFKRELEAVMVTTGRLKQRSGKWIPEEEEYCNRLVEEFTEGLIPLQEGVTLRSVLSRFLRCDPMRISKRFTGSNSIGKRVYKRDMDAVANLKPGYLANTRRELAALEQVYLSAGSMGVYPSDTAPPAIKGAQRDSREGLRRGRFGGGGGGGDSKPTSQLKAEGYETAMSRQAQAHASGAGAGVRRLGTRVATHTRSGSRGNEDGEYEHDIHTQTTRRCGYTASGIAHAAYNTYNNNCNSNNNSNNDDESHLSALERLATLPISASFGHRRRSNSNDTTFSALEQSWPSMANLVDVAAQAAQREQRLNCHSHGHGHGDKGGREGSTDEEASSNLDQNSDETLGGGGGGGKKRPRGEESVEAFQRKPFSKQQNTAAVSSQASRQAPDSSPKSKSSSSSSSASMSASSSKHSLDNSSGTTSDAGAGAGAGAVSGQSPPKPHVECIMPHSVSVQNFW